MDLFALLRQLVDEGGSDIFLSAGAAPHMKVQEATRPIGTQTLSGGEIRTMIATMMSQRQVAQFDAQLECNLGVNVGALGRFRVNVFMQRGEPAAVIRFIPASIPTIEELGLPKELEALSMQKHGLIVLAGPAGCGKSTTIAAMLDYRNSHEAGHILTIEDPIEFVHLHKKCVVDQREVGVDTLSLADALHNALREDPDVVMLGEIRTREAMQYAVSFAETGHLCLSTLHAEDAAKGIDRMVSFYPADARPQILMDLSLNLRAILTQRLAAGEDGKRKVAVDVLVNTPDIADLLRAGDLEKVRSSAQKYSWMGAAA
jgi:twitching motility protein PilU